MTTPSLNAGYAVMARANATVYVDNATGLATGIGTLAGDTFLVQSTIPANTAVSPETVSRAVTIADNGKRLVSTGSSPVTFTVPAGLGINFYFSAFQAGTGKITIAVSGGATINNPSAQFSTSAQYGKLTIDSYAVDAYQVNGNVGP